MDQETLGKYFVFHGSDVVFFKRRNSSDGVFFKRRNSSDGDPLPTLYDKSASMNDYYYVVYFELKNV